MIASREYSPLAFSKNKVTDNGYAFIHKLHHCLVLQYLICDSVLDNSNLLLHINTFLSFGYSSSSLYVVYV